MKKRGNATLLSRPRALPRYPQEFNPKVIRKLSVGLSEKRTIPLEWPAHIARRQKICEEEKGRETKQKTIKKKKKRERRKQIGCSLIFPVSFRAIFDSQVAEQEDAGGYDEEEAIRVR